MKFRFQTFKNLIYFLLTVLFFFSFFLFSLPVQAEEKPSGTPSNKTVEITNGWQYRMGDSTFNAAGLPLWTLDSASASDWKPLDCPGQVPNVTTEKDTWLRVQLPDGKWLDPSLYFRTYEQDFEVYLDGKLLFKYGEITAPDNPKRPGSPLIIFQLPEGYQNKTIYFRMHSIFTRNTGLIQGLALGSKSDHILGILKTDLDKAILTLLFIFIGLAAILLSILKTVERKAFFSLGYFSICVALWILGQTEIKQLFYNNPKVWYYIVHISNYMMPVGIIGYIEQIFATGKVKTLLRRIWQFQLTFSIVAFLLDITNIYVMTNFIKGYFILFVIYILLLLIVVLRASIHGNTESKLFLIGFLTLCLFAINDFLSVYFMMLPWNRSFIHWGVLLFVLSLLLILGLRFIEIFDRLKIYSMEIEAKNKTLNQMWKELKYSRDKLVEWNENLEETIKQKTYAIKNILNNAGQGFLTFGDDMLVQDEYSTECEKIFDKKIAHTKFSDLIYPDGEEKKYLELMLIKILHEKSEFKKEIYLPLLPDEIVVNNKFIKISYKVIENTQFENNKIFMTILTDITDKRFLENKMEDERKILKMVVKAVTNYNDFTKFIRDYESFCKTRIFEILDNGSPLQSIVFEIFRTIHTFKGSFGQMDMVNVVGKLNDFETKLSEINSNLGNTTIEEFKDFISGFTLYDWLNQDMNTLKEVLGQQYFNHEKALLVDQAKLIQIESKLVKLLSPPQLQVLLPEMRELRYRPFKELLQLYPQFVAKLSTHLQKPIHPVEIKGKELFVDVEKYHDFSVSLVHVFRNLMDHGIEPVAERIINGKEEFGKIDCRVKQIKNHISLVISDDGHGIDIEKIREKAIEKNIYDRESAYQLKDNEVLKLIFKDGFTVKDTVTELSGRGVGLSAVKYEVEKLNGSVTVKTKMGVGTEFHFLLPK